MAHPTWVNYLLQAPIDHLNQAMPIICGHRFTVKVQITGFVFKEHTRRPKAGVPGPGSSVAEIDILQRLIDLAFLDQRDGGLQVIAFLAADAKLVALDRDLHLDLRALDRLDDLLGEVALDALLDQHRLAQ